MQVQWSKNDKLFRSELLASEKLRVLVAEKLTDAGFSVEMPPMEWRESIKDAHKFKDQQDLIVEGYVIEVKSRRLNFTCPEDYPYSTAFVETVRSWDQKSVKPAAVILVSTITKDCVVIGRQSEKHWSAEQRFDHIRKIKENFYMVHKDLIISWDNFIDKLKKAKYESNHD